LSSQNRAPLEPQRDVGRQRVAGLLQAAGAVFQERGFEAATMAEIAARADAKIGTC
jgi:AcrR family transcriptional regulator